MGLRGEFLDGIYGLDAWRTDYGWNVVWFMDGMVEWNLNGAWSTVWLVN